MPRSAAFTSSLKMMSSSGSGTPVSVTVVGGTGFVGSRVCKILVEKGASVTSVSKTGTIPKWCSDEPWTKDVTWSSVDLTSADNESTLDSAIGKPEAIVSCVGVVGTDKDLLMLGNGAANAAAFASAKRGGKVQRAAFVSVGSEVAACQESWLPEFFGGYFDGKLIAEEAALDAVAGNSDKLCVVKPTFIYGGDSFGLLPPRVNKEYGSGVDQLLSFSLIEAVANVAPGLIKVALRPPVSVDDVAGACAAAAMDEGTMGVLDDAAAINKVTDYPPATGLTDALDFAYSWVKVEVPKFVDWAQKKIDEAKTK